MWKLFITLLVVSSINSLQFRREYWNNKESVGVYDDENNSLYGIVLAPKDTYEEVIKRHRQHMVSPHSFKNNCSVIATEEDMKYLNIQQELKEATVKSTLCFPDEVYFNADFQIQFGYPTCLETKQPTWSNMSPKKKIKRLITASFTNNMDDEKDEDFVVSASFMESISIQNDIASVFQKDVQFSIKEGLDQIEYTDIIMSHIVNSRETDDLDKIKKQSTTKHIKASLASGECIQYGIQVTALNYNDKYEVEQKPSNYFGASYKHRCHGHYFYFINLNDMNQEDLTRSVKGHINAQIGTNYETFVEKCN